MSDGERTSAVAMIANVVEEKRSEDDGYIVVCAWMEGQLCMWRYWIV